MILILFIYLFLLLRNQLIKGFYSNEIITIIYISWVLFFFSGIVKLCLVYGKMKDNKRIKMFDCSLLLLLFFLFGIESLYLYPLVVTSVGLLRDWVFTVRNLKKHRIWKYLILFIYFLLNSEKLSLRKS